MTPLLHAMRIGSSHKDVAILLVGAMSRFVNHLEDEDMDKPKTKVLLKALRTSPPFPLNHTHTLTHPSIYTCTLYSLFAF